MPRRPALRLPQRDPYCRLKDVSLRVDEGKIVSLLGANGAGKTTTVRTVVGLNRSSANDIRLERRPIGRIPPHKIVRLGIAMVPDRS